jgi:hypothetical protein
MNKSTKDNVKVFEDTSRKKAPGAFLEVLDFLRNNKKWWLTPIIIGLLLLAALLTLGGTGVAPIIYTLF